MNASFGWSRADPAARLVIAAAAVRERVREECLAGRHGLHRARRPRARGAPGGLRAWLRVLPLLVLSVPHAGGPA